MGVLQKVLDWMENKGYHLMTASIVLQIVIFVLLILIYIMAWEKTSDLNYNIYSWSVLALFMAFMIHFAYHSLIAFLLMSTLSSGLLIFSFFAYVINNNNLEEDLRGICSVLGIISVILLILGNIIYFISAYFAYSHFELIFMNKFGAKLSYHTIFKWMQFQHSMMKSDLGLIIFLLITTFIFDNANVGLLVVDSFYLVASIVIVVFMRINVRKESKRSTFIILGVRILLEGYKIFRVFYLFTIEESTSRIKKDFRDKFAYGVYSVIFAMIFDEVIFILCVFSTVKCVLNYGKGFKEMLDKQKKVEDGEDKNAYLSSGEL